MDKLSRRSFVRRVIAGLVGFVPAAKVLLNAAPVDAQSCGGPPPGYKRCSVQVCYESRRTCDPPSKDIIIFYDCYDYYDRTYCETITGVIPDGCA